MKPAIFLKGILGAWVLFSIFDAHGAEPGARWWKGNLHAHSHWSDGDDYPESITEWYRSRGYSFLMFTEHNVMQEGERWVEVAKSKGGQKAFDQYLLQMGKEWVQTREVEGKLQVRLRGLEEYRSLFESPGQFLLIRGEEITARFLSGPGKPALPIHMNGTHLKELIIPQSGKDVSEVLEKNMEAVAQQREKTGQPMMAHVNHPNFFYAITAQDMARVAAVRFFEVYNGHPTVHNAGDASHPGTEQMWDMMLTLRLGTLGTGLVYGLATDDGHHYHDFKPARSNPGRGWVHVLSSRLSPALLVRAMERGDFYASSGVELKSLEYKDGWLRVEVQPEDGVEYRVRFVGTLENVRGRPLDTLSDSEVGQILQESKGTQAAYHLTGRELYVRAVVESSKLMENPGQVGDFEKAWIQPVLPR